MTSRTLVLVVTTLSISTAHGCKAHGPIAAAVVEPSEPLAGLDLLLTLVPEGAEFMLARDATVIAEYMEEGTRFLDGPMATLGTGPLAAEPCASVTGSRPDHRSNPGPAHISLLSGSFRDCGSGAAL